MRGCKFYKYKFIYWLFVTFCYAQFSFAQTQVLIQPTPDGGIQPRLLNDKHGGIHLLYFKQLTNLAPKIGHLYYRYYLQDQGDWSTEVQVSTQQYTHPDAIGRAGAAIDGDGRIHVVWYQFQTAQYFYTRSNTERTSFEPQRAIVTDNIEGVDAGADITASGSTVAVVWAAGDLMNEAGRTVYTRVSTDGGGHFGEEQGVSDPADGACACCGLAADFAGKDELAVAFRSAIEGKGRHMQLLSADLDKGRVENSRDYYSELQPLQKWEISGCPVTTNDFAVEDNSNTWLVFETQGRIVQLNLRDDVSVAYVSELSSESRQKNPAIAVNDRHEKLIAWGEAPGYVQGGTLKYRIFRGREAVTSSDSEPAQTINIPDYSFPAAAALRNGDFLILY